MYKFYAASRKTWYLSFPLKIQTNIYHQTYMFFKLAMTSFHYSTVISQIMTKHLHELINPFNIFPFNLHKPLTCDKFLNLVIHIIRDVYSLNQKLPHYMNSGLQYPELQIQCSTWTRVALACLNMSRIPCHELTSYDESPESSVQIFFLTFPPPFLFHPFRMLLAYYWVE